MKLYYTDFREFHDLSGIEYLPSGRQERIVRYRRSPDKARCLAAGLLLQTFVVKPFGSPLDVDPSGKPVLADNRAYFNVSHSGDFIVLAVSSHDVGVDIEQVLPYSRAAAKKCFTPLELVWLDQQNSDRAFYTLWTAKESVMKATGLGFLMPPESFQIVPFRNGPHIVHEKNWYLHWTALDDHELCIASPIEQNTVHPTFVSRAELLQSSASISTSL